MRIVFMRMINKTQDYFNIGYAFHKMRIVFMRMINKTQDVMPRNIINLSGITCHWE